MREKRTETQREGEGMNDSLSRRWVWLPLPAMQMGLEWEWDESWETRSTRSLPSGNPNMRASHIGGSDHHAEYYPAICFFFFLIMTSEYNSSISSDMQSKTNDLSIIRRKTDCIILETRIQAYLILSRFDLLHFIDIVFFNKLKISHQWNTYGLLYHGLESNPQDSWSMPVCWSLTYHLPKRFLVVNFLLDLTFLICDDFKMLPRITQNYAFWTRPHSK